MNILQIIEKKKLKKELSQDEINFFINEYVNDKIPDYQISALLMAIRLNGMTDNETFYLTNAMVNSGDAIDLSEIDGFKIDKHSTGGIGDKITLIVAPIIASLGIPVAKFSGKSLGITGGTIDKLNSIKGFKTELDINTFIANVKKIGIAISSQTKNIVPADKKLYALRDVTSTVDSIPLIASSVISKKIASGADGIVLDVKYGNGAFIKFYDEAKLLGEKMKTIGEKFGKKIDIHISDMNNPLGRYIGNKLEVVEAYNILCGNFKSTHDDLINECLKIAKTMYKIATNVDDNEAYEKVKNALYNESAKNKFVEFINLQEGDINDIKISDTDYVLEVKSTTSGFIKQIDAELIGIANLELGAGRTTINDAIDYDAGIYLNKKQNDEVGKDDVLATLYSNRPIKQQTIDKIINAYKIQNPLN